MGLRGRQHCTLPGLFLARGAIAELPRSRCRGARVGLPEGVSSNRHLIPSWGTGHQLTRTARAVVICLSSLAIITIGSKGMSCTPSNRNVTRQVTVNVTCFMPGRE